ncbi:MAG: HlyD family secretion protein [Candidatus Omnitrophica bacterium]|nr:HlyD family secretion protein [Candidatus Omnitrophota bacterium]
MALKINKKMIYVITAGAAVAGIFLSGYLANNLGRVSTDDAYIEGRIHSIAPKIPGTVKTVNVRDNQVVKEGDILIEIDPVDYELKAAEAKANLDIRKAALEQASRDINRAETLYNEKVFPKERYENSLTAFNLAKAQVEAAEAQFGVAQRNLLYTKICAPSDGHVTKKSVEAGNQVQPAQPLMAIVPDDIWVVANFKETQLTRMRPGQEAEIRVDTYPGKVFWGHVDSIQRGTGSKFSMFPPENAAGNFVKVVQRIPVKIVFDIVGREKNPLSIGMSVIPKVKVR